MYVSVNQSIYVCEAASFVSLYYVQHVDEQECYQTGEGSSEDANQDLSLGLAQASISHHFSLYARGIRFRGLIPTNDMLTFFLFLQANFKQSRVIIQEIMRTMLRTPLFLIIQHPSQSQLLNIQIAIVYIQTKKMSKQDFAYTLKILIIGNSGVGKSCLLMRFSENKFQSNLLNTIGVDFKTKIVESEGQKVKLVLWDTAGQDRFRTITNSYYRNANGVIIVYDITDRTSFENVITWYDEINKNVDQKIGCFFVGNKLDMSAKRVVSFEEGNALATKYKVPFMETSAKNSHNVNELFQNLTRQMISLNSGPKPTHKRPPMPIKSSDKEEEMCRCCEN